MDEDVLVMEQEEEDEEDYGDSEDLDIDLEEASGEEVWRKVIITEEYWNNSICRNHYP